MVESPSLLLSFSPSLLLSLLLSIRPPTHSITHSPTRSPTSSSQAVDAAMVESPRQPAEGRPSLLQLSGDEKVKLKQQLSDGTRGLRESRDSTVGT